MADHSTGSVTARLEGDPRGALGAINQVNAALRNMEAVGRKVSAGGIAGGFSQSAAAAGASIDGLGQKITRMGGISLSGIIGSLGAIGLAASGIQAIGGAINGLMRDAIDAEKVQAMLNAVLESTGGISGQTSESVNALSDSLSRVTPYEDEAIGAAQNMLLTFTRIGSEVFPSATEAVLNMSTALGQDLQSSAIQLGKALNSPVEGVTALQRVGVRLTDAQKEQVAQFMKVNDVVSAQRVILEELQTEFGGAARAAGETFAGKLKILETQLGNVKEAIGGPLLSVISGLVDRLTSVMPGIVEFANYIGSTFGPYIQAGIELAGEAFNWLSGIVSSALSSVLSIIVSVGQAIYDALSWLNPFAEHSPSLVDQVAEGMQEIGDSYGGITDIATPLESAGRSIQNFAGLSKDALKNMVDDTKDSLEGMKSALRSAQDALRGFTNAPIEGMGALDDQKFALEQQRNQVQLQIDQLKLGGASSHDIMTESSKGHPATVAQAASPELQALEAQLANLGLQASALDLQGRIKFDPLQRQIKQMTNTVKELTFDQIVAGIKGSKGQIDLLTPAVAAGEASLKLQTKAMAAMAEAAGKAAKAAGGGKGGAGDGLTTTMGKVQETFKGVNESVKTFRDGVTTARERITGLTASVTNFLAPIGQLVSYLQPDNTVDLMGKWFGPDFGPRIDEVIRRIKELVGTVTDQIKNIGDLVTGKENLGTFLSRMFNIGGQQIGIGAGLTTALAGLGDQIIKALTPIGERVGAWALAQVPVITAQLSVWQKAFVAWITPAFNALVAALPDEFKKFMDWIGLQSDPIIKQLGTWANAFIAWIGPATVDFLAQWPGMLNRFLDWIENNVGPIAKSLLTWAAAFIAWVVPMIPDFLVALGTIALAIGAWLLTTTITIAGRLANWAAAFLIWVVPMIPGFLLELDKLGKAFSKWIDDESKILGDQAFKWGVHILDEWVRGIKSQPILGINLGGPIFTPPTSGPFAPTPSASSGAHEGTAGGPNITVNLNAPQVDPIASRNQTTQGVHAAARALGLS